MSTKSNTDEVLGTKNTKNNLKKDQDLEKNDIEEVAGLKKLLFKIWGVTEILQNDVGYLKKLYTTPRGQKKQNLSREDRKALLKHKLLTRKRKLD